MPVSVPPTLRFSVVPEILTVPLLSNAAIEPAWMLRAAPPDLLMVPRLVMTFEPTALLWNDEVPVRLRVPVDWLLKLPVLFRKTLPALPMFAVP